jgi:hypothetical protein
VPPQDSHVRSAGFSARLTVILLWIFTSALPSPTDATARPKLGRSIDSLASYERSPSVPSVPSVRICVPLRLRPGPIFFQCREPPLNAGGRRFGGTALDLVPSLLLEFFHSMLLIIGNG